MKNIISILTGVLIAYFLFSFTLADINFLNWSEEERGYCVIFMLLFGASSFAIKKLSED